MQRLDLHVYDHVLLCGLYLEETASLNAVTAMTVFYQRQLLCQTEYRFHLLHFISMTFLKINFLFVLLLFKQLNELILFESQFKSPIANFYSTKYQHFKNKINLKNETTTFKKKHSVLNFHLIFVTNCLRDQMKSNTENEKLLENATENDFDLSALHQPSSQLKNMEISEIEVKSDDESEDDTILRLEGQNLTEIPLDIAQAKGETIRTLILTNNNIRHEK
ncbi:hypothetical protein RFI_08411 [Reticulomyxa filosa]|uniref:Uncharacterized protein n=1 Tax=Reticulomyxa filosa TaxID=46433 RepID=X6NQY6_RETFI|nr:hypothetical protein RFI_08411 [Reticulomyxa filosa]|eukprot:ETO28720.1 hypothetical protein RFI_08411 [Reticulomyxa filosa]